MTIRRRILIGIVPVFLFLALVGNGVHHFLERRAIIIGLQQQAGTFAAALAAFARAGDWEKFEAGRTGATAYPAALARLERWNMLRSAAIWRLSDRQVLLQWGPAAEIPPLPADRAGDFAQGAPFVASDLISLGSDEAIIAAYAPLAVGPARPAGLIGVSISANFLLEELAGLQRRMLVSAFVITLIGAALALAISARLSFELRRLTRSAAGIENGRYVPPPPGLIAEISDVGETFGVLDDVIDEVRAKSHRAYIENEQFRTEDDLLRIFREELLAPLAVTRAHLAVTLATTGSDATVFRELARDETAGRICFGHVEGPAGLETAILASATGQELEDRLARGEEPEAALRGAAALFPLRSATVLTWTGSEVRRWDFTPGTVRSSSHEVLRAGGWVGHDLPAEAAAAVAIYLRRFPAESPGQRVRDLAHLAGHNGGTVAVFSLA